MGAWSTYPKDSDGAYDLKYLIEKSINKELEIICKTKYSYDFAGLIMILLQCGFFIKVKFIEKAIDNMNEMLDLTVNGNKVGWKNAEKAKEDITFLIKEFRTLLDQQKNIYLKSNIIGGKSVKGKNEKQRLRMYLSSTILAPRNWLARKHELEVNSSHTGMFEMYNEQKQLKKQENLKKKILSEYKKGNIVVASHEGIMSAKLSEIIKQPVDGLLYDLNRGEATILTFIGDAKWINDYASTKVIRALSSRIMELESEIEKQKNK